METYRGHVKTPADAIILFEACRLGLLPRVQRRLSEKERQQINSGSVFVWDEREAGMRRWTDGKSWSASRVSGSFLTYREMEGKRGSNSFNSPSQHPDSKMTNGDADPADSPDGYRYKPDGLMKQSFSITTAVGHHLHLISYFARSHQNSSGMPQPSTDPSLRGIRAEKGMYPESTMHDVQSVAPTTRSPMAGSPYGTSPGSGRAQHNQNYLRREPHRGPLSQVPGQYGWPPSPMDTPPNHYTHQSPYVTSPEAGPNGAPSYASHAGGPTQFDRPPPPMGSRASAYQHQLPTPVSTYPPPTSSYAPSSSTSSYAPTSATSSYPLPPSSSYPHESPNSSYPQSGPPPYAQSANGQYHRSSYPPPPARYAHQGPIPSPGLVHPAESSYSNGTYTRSPQYAEPPRDPRYEQDHRAYERDPRYEQDQRANEHDPRSHDQYLSAPPPMQSHLPAPNSNHAHLPPPFASAAPPQHQQYNRVQLPALQQDIKSPIQLPQLNESVTSPQEAQGPGSERASAKTIPSISALLNKSPSPHSAVVLPQMMPMTTPPPMNGVKKAPSPGSLASIMHGDVPRAAAVQSQMPALSAPKPTDPAGRDQAMLRTMEMRSAESTSPKTNVQHVQPRPRGADQEVLKTLNRRFSGYAESQVDAQHAQDERLRLVPKSESESPTEWAFKTRTALVHSSELGWSCENGTCDGSKAPAEVDAIRVVACNCVKDVREQGDGE